MGACCCCPARKTEVRGESEELEGVPLSSQHAPSPAFSTRLLVDTNLDTSPLNTYRSPPTPMPYDIALEHPRTSSVTRDIEMSKPVESIDLEIEEEEDSCPICLEEYDKENPKLTTKCDHHFHLACILEWMERSNRCPVCDQEMILDPPMD